VSAAEALPLPFGEPDWRDTSLIRNRIPTAADLAACPPAQGPPADHLAALQRLLRAVDPADEDDFLDDLYQAHVDQAFIEHAEHVKDWPPAEPEHWS
jgi:hypothetical protein